MRTIRLFLLTLLLPLVAHAQVTLPQSVQDFFSLPPSNYVQARALSASTAETIVPPAWAKYVLFACTDNFYVNYTTTATVPGDTTDGSASELNPSMRRLTRPNNASISAISIISAGTPVCTASFYQ